MHLLDEWAYAQNTSRCVKQAPVFADLLDGYFTALITDYENKRGEIMGMQREPRGTLYHPHLRQRSRSAPRPSLYGRPFWTFNKMVYIEKAGTQQNLIEVGWPEEFDAAIASVAGFTTRAVKDLFDLLATSSEPVTVFCVHDADAAGTMIYHTLQNETKARCARKIEVVNLGLEPWKASRWGSRSSPSRRRTGVAPLRPTSPSTTPSGAIGWRCTVTVPGKNGCNTNRIELNAMPPARRIAAHREDPAASPAQGRAAGNGPARGTRGCGARGDQGRADGARTHRGAYRRDRPQDRVA